MSFHSAGLLRKEIKHVCKEVELKYKHEPVVWLLGGIFLQFKEF